jgi:hypothetical protein
MVFPGRYCETEDFAGIRFYAFTALRSAQTCATAVVNDKRCSNMYSYAPGLLCECIVKG